MKVIDLTNDKAIRIMAFALDTKKVLIGLRNDYIQEIEFLKEVQTK